MQNNNACVMMAFHKKRNMCRDTLHALQKLCPEHIKNFLTLYLKYAPAFNQSGIYNPNTVVGMGKGVKKRKEEEREVGEKSPPTGATV